MSTTKVRLIIAIYAAAFSLGVISHLLDFIAEGFRPYASAPAPLEVFWSLLIVVDAAVVGALLTGWRRTALVSAAAVMWADVGLNTYAVATGTLTFGLFLVLQAVFLGFIAGSFAFVSPRQPHP